MNQTDVLPFPYTIRRNRRSKHIRIAVHDKEVRVSAPRRASDHYIKTIIREHASWIIKKISESRTNNAYALPRIGDREAFNRHRAEAHALVHDRIQKFNEEYNFSFNKIAIRNQKTRWGSCSKQGNLNFNYRIVLLPLHLTDYLIVHELCHLGEMNHSKKFWDMVGRTIPEYRQHRKDLNAIKFGS